MWEDERDEGEEKKKIGERDMTTPQCEEHWDIGD